MIQRGRDMRKRMQRSHGGGAVWTPAQLSPTAWYRADSGVTGTTSVTAWLDKSGNGHDLVGGTSAEPEYVASGINGQPVISFDDATQEYMDKAGGTIITAETEVWIVFEKDTSTNSGQTMVDVESEAQGAAIRQSATGDTYTLYTSSTVISTDTIADDTPGYITGLFSTAGSDSIAINNGTPVTGTINAPTGTGIRLGARGGVAAVFFDGDIAEVIVLPSAASGAAKTSLVAYIADRYGV